jgi:hypothetical protein
MDGSTEMDVDVQDPISDALCDVEERKAFMAEATSTVASWLAECSKLRQQLQDGPS